MKLRCLVIALAFVAAFASDSWGQSKQPPQRTQSQTTQQQPAADQRGTENFPVVVKILPAKENEEKAKADAKEHDEKQNLDRDTFRLSVATVVIIFLQLLIFAAQAWFLWGTLRATAEAARAAQQQGNILAAVEGPLPLIAGIKLVQYTRIPGEIAAIDPVPGGGIPSNCRILFCIENKGRTPLRMIELCIEKFAGAALPAHPVYEHTEPWGLILEKGPLWIRASDTLAFVTPADVGAATAVYPNGAFWVFGYFAYFNLLNERIEHKFLARWDLTHGFIADNRPGYS